MHSDTDPEILSAETITAIRTAAVELGTLDPAAAVDLVSKLVSDGAVSAPLSASLDPAAAARLQLAQFADHRPKRESPPEVQHEKPAVPPTPPEEEP